MLNVLQDKIMAVISPIADVLSNNKYMKALTAGMMGIMCISLGTAAIAVLVNLPFTWWSDFLNNSGLYQVAQDTISVTLSLLAIYAVVSIAYSYARDQKENPLAAALLSLATFLVLIPLQSATVGEDTAITAFNVSYLGSNGIFVAMLTGLIVSSFFCWLCKKNITLKLPDSMPSMISNSLSPVFVAMIILTMAFFVKYAFSLTPYGNVFDMVTEIISKPVMAFGSSPMSMLLFYTVCNLFWFFGVHPSPLQSAYALVALPVIYSLIEEFASTGSVSNPEFLLVFMVAGLGGTGSTLGLALDTFTAKSEKYKTMNKLVVIPNIFNINEPIIFGFPIIMNPIYFLPMVLSSLVNGFVGLLLLKIIPVNINPTIQTPWVTPTVISALLQGGLGYFVIVLACLLADMLLYLPFFKIDDARALKEEQASQAQEAEIANPELVKAA